MNGNALPYRAGTGVVLLNPQCRIFVGQRLDTTMEAWQMPQGGIDPGEEPEAAALRELEEEIGTRHVRILAQTKGWHTYDLPPALAKKVWGGRFRGQRQLWFLMRFLGQDGEINLATPQPEFRAWKWIAPGEAGQVIVPFKRELYRQVMAEFRPLIEAGKI
jgi:putative (di)nucleoside polyphosphate hydrolase